MIRLKGGLEGLPQDLMLRKLLIITDYQIACSVERDIYLQQEMSDWNDSIPILASYSTEFHSPLLQSSTRFVELVTPLNISTAVAEILDDMKFLTTSILSLNASENQESAKFQATALWAHDRIQALPTMNPNDSKYSGNYIYESCRIAALIYSSAIVTRKPISQVCSTAQLQDLWSKMWIVSLSEWKMIPGIFLWIVLVACPCSQDRLQRMWLKKMVATVAMYMSLVDYDVAAGYMKGFLKVQRWIAKGEEVVEDGGFNVVVGRSRADPE